MPEFGIGLTDVCKVRFGSDAEVGTTAHDPARLEESITRSAPTHLAFVGKQAARTALGRAVEYGCQDEPFAGAQVWVLPSPSGLASRFWSIEPWQELAAAVAKSRT